MAHPEQMISCAYNGYCWGGCTGDGTNASRQQIDGHDWGYSYASGSFSSTFTVAVYSDAYRDDELALLKYLEKPEKNLGVTWGKALELSDVAISSTTLSSTTGGFTAAMIGLPINIRNKGTVQITARASSNSITISEAIGNGSSLYAWVGYPLLRIVPGSRIGGYDVNTSVSFPSDQLCTGKRWVVRFGARWSQEADDARGCSASNRRDGKVSVSYSGSRLMTVTFTGTYAADDTSSGQSARTNYTSGFDIWRDAVFTTLSVSTNREEVETARREVEDDMANTLTFSRTYRELERPQASGGWNDANIANLRFSLDRNATWAHGKSGEIAPVYVDASWSCDCIASAKAYNAIVAYYTGTIKPYILSQTITLMGGSSCVIMSERGPVLSSDVNGNHLIGKLSLMIYGLGSSTLHWSESYIYRRAANYYFRKVHSGKPDHYTYWTPGATHFCTMSINASVIGTTNAPTLTPSQKEPPFTPHGSGKWLETDGGMNEGSYWIGNDVDAAGSVVQVTHYSWSRTFVWVSNEAIPEPTQTTTGGKAQTQPNWGK